MVRGANVPGAKVPGAKVPGAKVQRLGKLDVAAYNTEANGWAVAAADL
jgi:hypothetical protein